MYKTSELLNINKTMAKPLFEETEYPWQVLDMIGDFIREIGPALDEDEYKKIGDDVWAARDAEIYPTAYIKGPCIIGHNTQVRHCAFIRGSVIIGDDCVVGNSVEVKNAIVFDNVQIPHYNYVGDSVLGYHAHMGAGSITSNVKSDRTPVSVKDGAELINTGRKKFGAILGDYVEVGCNSVLNPGCVVGRNSTIYPVCSVRGTVPADSIYKGRLNVIRRK